MCVAGKRQQQIEEGGNPFIDENSWPSYLDSLKAKVNRIITDNAKLSEELYALLGKEA